MLRGVLTLVVLSGTAIPQDLTNSLQKALALFNSGKYQECLAVVAPYVEQHPDSAEAHKILGMDEFMLGDQAKALQEVKLATDLAPRDATAFYYLGRLYFTADNPVDALAAFRKAVDLNPSDVRFYHHLGQTYEALTHQSEAEQAYQKAIALGANQQKKWEWPYYSLGLLYLNGGRTDDAVTCFRQAIACNPAFCEGRIKLAQVLADRKLFSEALDLLQQAVKIEPSNAEAHYRLGLLLAKCKRPEEAQEQFALFEKYRKP
jgi:tetratricopeptide (TPR) repeat protein